MGFNAEAVKRIVAAIDRVNTSIQKTATYIAANTFGFGGASIVNSAGVSAVLAFLGVITLVPGTTDVTSGASGALNSQPGLGSAAVEITGMAGASGVLRVLTELGSSVVEISGVGGALGEIDIATKLRGIVEVISEVTGYPNQEYILGTVDGIAGHSAVLEIATKLRGSVDAEITSVGGSAELIL